MGFRTFNALRVFIAERAILLGDLKGDSKTTIMEKNINSMIAVNNESITKTFTNQKNLSTINTIAKEIKLCKNLLVYGYDLNSHPAKMMAEKFAELGVNTRYTSVKDLFTSYLSVFNGEGTIAIIFSSSLRNKKYSIFKEQCKINNIKLIFITASDNYPEYARIKLFLTESKAFKEYLVSNLQVMAVNVIYNTLILSSTKFQENEVNNFKIKD
jgi:DNA-binding MurR/RpiR family transcriptional regulator